MKGVSRITLVQIGIVTPVIILIALAIPLLTMLGSFMNWPRSFMGLLAPLLLIGPPVAFVLTVVYLAVASRLRRQWHVIDYHEHAMRRGEGQVSQACLGRLVHRRRCGRTLVILTLITWAAFLIVLFLWSAAMSGI